MYRQLIQLVILLTTISAIAQAALADGRLESLTDDKLVSTARMMLERAEIDKRSEKQLEQIVLVLGSRPASPAARSLVEDLSSRQPQIMVAHEEGGAMIPFVDVGATARFALRNWARRTAHDNALRATRAADPQFLQNYFFAGPETRAGILNAIRDSDAKNLLLYRDQLISRVTEPGGDKLAAEFAVALIDTTLAGRVIANGSAAVALDTVRRLGKTLDGDAALALMRLAIERADIASATLYEVGQLTPSLPAAELMLWELLPDPVLGGSAAAVLARHADRDTVDRLIGLLQKSDTQLIQKRALLALRLSGDARAGKIADAWTADQPGNER